MPRRPRLSALTLSVLVLATTIAAAHEPPQGKASVMLLGTFHFANPGLDVVKSEVVDVTTPDNQSYLEGLAKRLAAFRPTDVLVECDPATQARQDAAFAAYREGAATLRVNETQQIGFRVANAAGLDGVTCFDENEVHWNSGPLNAYLRTHAPDRQAAMEALFAALSAREANEQTTLPLPELLRLANSAERDRENKDLYLRTNAVDAGQGFVGADASASWWHRNFRMYANIQRAAAPGRRVLVIAGAGHTAIFRDLLAIDGERVAAHVDGYLAP